VTEREAVLAHFRAQLEEMVAGDTEILGDLLDDRFTLTHITGYVQPKAEWLAEMRAGQFDYHRIDEQNTTIRLDGDSAVVTGRIVTDATVYGAHSNWRLVLTQEYRRIRGGWSAQRSVATTW
jgi:hypothetical protein